MLLPYKKDMDAETIYTRPVKEFYEKGDCVQLIDPIHPWKTQFVYIVDSYVTHKGTEQESIGYSYIESLSDYQANEPYYTSYKRLRSLREVARIQNLGCGVNVLGFTADYLEFLIKNNSECTLKPIFDLILPKLGSDNLDFYLSMGYEYGVNHYKCWPNETQEDYESILSDIYDFYSDITRLLVNRDEPGHYVPFSLVAPLQKLRTEVKEYYDFMLYQAEEEGFEPDTTDNIFPPQVRITPETD